MARTGLRSRVLFNRPLEYAHVSVRVFVHVDMCLLMRMLCSVERLEAATVEYVNIPLQLTEPVHRKCFFLEARPLHAILCPFTRVLRHIYL